ncbi:MAG: V-type ATP synthase subunit D [Defluviitaleaceae bacterium]|nr:V-type ATP synthase subunit D [Defluviitaleaceae bacterium]
MDTLNLPIKRNLLLARTRLALARKGYDLLDKKRHVLINELSGVQKQAGQIWDDLCLALKTAYGMLHVSLTEMGRERVLKISQAMPKDARADVFFRGVMGVELPVAKSVTGVENTRVLPYALSETTASLDEAVLAWNKACELIVSWGVIENTVYRLNLHIKKTLKRANALGNITIPMYEARVRYIQQRLEERERDELARLKLVKGSRVLE